LGVFAYQAPELIATTEAATDAETDEEVPINESPIDREIYSDKLTTKTDVYAYAMVALQVCSVFDVIHQDDVLGHSVLESPRYFATLRHRGRAM
jgi:hypothetical protein